MANKAYETRIIITGDSKGGVLAISKFDAAAQKMGLTSRKASREAGTAFDRLSRQSRNARQDFMLLGTSASDAGSMIRRAFQFTLGIAGIHAMAEGIRDVYTAATQMQGFETAYASIFDGFENGAAQLNFVKEIAYDLGLNLRTLAKDYQLLSAAAQGTNLEGAETDRIFIAMAKAGRALNMSADDIHGSLRAMQQMMSKGKVQAEELRGQLGERLPGAVQLAARALGVTTAELDKMLENGQVLADDLLPRLATELEKVYGEGAEKASQNAVASMERLKTAFFELSASIGQAGGLEMIGNAAEAAATKLRDLADMIGSGELMESIDLLTEHWSSGFERMVTDAGMSMAAIRQAWGDTGRFMGHFGDQTVKVIADAFMHLPHNLRGLWGILVYQTATTMVSIREKFELLKSSWTFLTDGMKNSWTVVWSAIRVVALRALSGIRNLYADTISKIYGPLADLAGALGLDDFAANLRGAMRSLQRGAASATAEIATLENEIMGLEAGWSEGMRAQHLRHRESIQSRAEMEREAHLERLGQLLDEIELTKQKYRDEKISLEERNRLFREAEQQMLALNRASLVGGTTTLGADGKIQHELPPSQRQGPIDRPAKVNAAAKRAEDRDILRKERDHRRAVERLQEDLLKLQEIDDPFGARSQRAVLKYEATLKRLLTTATDYNEAKEMALQLLEAELRLADPIAKAWDDYHRAAKFTAQDAADIMTDSFQQMEDSLASFIRTGKLDFSSFVDHILDEMARMTAKQIVSGMTQSLLPGLGSSGGLSSALSTLFGGALGGLTGGLFGASAGSTAEAASFMTADFDSIGAGGITPRWFHTGGVPAAAEGAGRRTLPASVFERAPRYHTGIGPREQAAVIRRDEGVFTPGQMASMASIDAVRAAVGGSGGNTVTFAPQINIDARGAAPGAEAGIRRTVRDQMDESFRQYQNMDNGMRRSESQWGAQVAKAAQRGRRNA